jgi:hypothetical protein
MSQTPLLIETSFVDAIADHRGVGRASETDPTPLDDLLAADR